MRWTSVVFGALLMVAMALAPQHRVTVCTMDCCQVAIATGCDMQHAAPTRPSCSCCQHAHQHRAPKVPAPSVRGRCKPGCCVALLFDIDLLLDAHAVSFDATPCLCSIPSRCPLPAVLLSQSQPQPHDRGPPRTDAGAERRRCTVLLI